MILYILDQVYSWRFALGAAAGTVFWQLYCRSKARYLDRHHPLDHGQKHAVSRMSRQWTAGLLAAASLGYVLLSVGKIQLHTQELHNEVARCWSETYQQIKAQVQINAENDGLQREQQDLQREYDRDTSDWLKSLLNPPGQLANMDPNSQPRHDWALQTTAEYQDQLNQLGTQFDELVAKRANLDQQRAAHPLPEAQCGKSS